jgi:hypothetical protein
VVEAVSHQVAETCNRILETQNFSYAKCITMARAVSASHLVLAVRQEDIDAVIRLCALDAKVASRSTEDGITALQVRRCDDTHARRIRTCGRHLYRHLCRHLWACNASDVVRNQLVSVCHSLGRLKSIGSIEPVKCIPAAIVAVMSRLHASLGIMCRRGG